MENNIEEDNHVGGMCVIPTVSYEFKPRLELQFDSLEEVYKFYNKYAKMGGFGIRKDSGKRLPHSNVVSRKEYTCYKSGFYEKEKPEGAQNIRQRGCTRTNCKAKIAVRLQARSSKYAIVTFIEEHNHEMTTPDRVHLLASHRKGSDTKKIVLEQLNSGGLENIGCTKVIGHDVRLLREYFKAEKKKNASFYWFMEIVGEGRMGNVFWADARSRRAYEYFGDVLLFETTSNANRYGLSFAPIIGVNNHRQTQLLACAYLQSESVESFCWLFDQLKKAMPGCPPKMIITDQNPAIVRAVKESLPKTFHRFCIWHIMKKFGEKNVGEALFALTECIWDMDTKDQYDAKWGQVLTANGLESDVWLASIHDLRHYWVPAYVKHVFSAGMSSSLKAETCHDFFKKCISPKNTLMEFIVQFDRAVASQRHKELEADHRDKDQEPPREMRMMTPMNSQMATIYTRHIFDIFHTEQMRSLHCFLACQKEENTQSVYNVEERVSSEISCVKELVYDKDIDQCFCSCKVFEFHGVPCRHILAYLRRNQVVELPETYILKRWTQSAKIGVVHDKEGKEIKDFQDGDVLVKRAKFYNDALDLIDEALLTDEGSQLLSKTLSELYGKLISMRHLKARQKEPNHILGISFSIVNDPLQGVNKRVRGRREEAEDKKQNGCSGCKGTGHDIRNCPKKTKRSFPSDTEEANQEWENADDLESTSEGENSEDGENTQLSQPSGHEALLQEFDVAYPK